MSRVTEDIMATTGAVAATSILALIAAIPTELKRWRPIGPLGLAAAGLALLLTVFEIWVPYSWTLPFTHGDFEKVLGVVWVTAVAFPHMGLLSLARLRPQWNWVRIGTVLVVVVLALQICATIIFNFRWGDEWERAMGILGIVTGCGTIAVPILHKVSAIKLREAVRTTELSLAITCPRCGKGQTLSVGKSKCNECGLGFSIEIEEENCKKCGYPFYKIESAVCPECGTPIFRPATA